MSHSSLFFPSFLIVKKIFFFENYARFVDYFARFVDYFARFVEFCCIKHTKNYVLSCLLKKCESIKKGE
jgi:hypothetical protein